MRVMIVREGSVADAARMTDRISPSLCLQEIRSWQSSATRSLRHTGGRRSIARHAAAGRPCIWHEPYHLKAVDGSAACSSSWGALKNL